MRGQLMLRAFTISGSMLAMVVLLVLGVSAGPGVSPAVSGIAGNLSDSRTPAPPPPPETVPVFPDRPRLLQGESRTTLQGDDINNAIATYGIDETGQLYEVHSPQTEVPTLGAPKT